MLILQKLAAIFILTAAAQSVSLTDVVTHYAEQFRVDPQIMLAVINCESAGNLEARGQAGEIGVAQFMPQTFAHYASLAGLDQPNIYDAHQQIIVMAYMFSLGEAHQWTCYRNLVK